MRTETCYYLHCQNKVGFPNFIIKKEHQFDSPVNEPPKYMTEVFYCCSEDCRTKMLKLMNNQNKTR